MRRTVFVAALVAGLLAGIAFAPPPQDAGGGAWSGGALNPLPIGDLLDVGIHAQGEPAHQEQGEPVGPPEPVEQPEPEDQPEPEIVEPEPAEPEDRSGAGRGGDGRRAGARAGAGADGPERLLVGAAGRHHGPSVAGGHRGRGRGPPSRPRARRWSRPRRPHRGRDGGPGRARRRLSAARRRRSPTTSPSRTCSSGGVNFQPPGARAGQARPAPGKPREASSPCSHASSPPSFSDPFYCCPARPRRRPATASASPAASRATRAPASAWTPTPAIEYRRAITRALSVGVAVPADVTTDGRRGDPADPRGPGRVARPAPVRLRGQRAAGRDRRHRSGLRQPAGGTPRTPGASRATSRSRYRPGPRWAIDVSLGRQFRHGDRAVALRHPRPLPGVLRPLSAECKDVGDMATNGKRTCWIPVRGTWETQYEARDIAEGQAERRAGAAAALVPQGLDVLPFPGSTRFGLQLWDFDGDAADPRTPPLWSGALQGTLWQVAPGLDDEHDEGRLAGRRPAHPGADPAGGRGRLRAHRHRGVQPRGPGSGIRGGHHAAAHGCCTASSSRSSPWTRPSAATSGPGMSGRGRSSPATCTSTTTGLKTWVRWTGARSFRCRMENALNIRGRRGTATRSTTWRRTPPRGCAPSSTWASSSCRREGPA